MNTFRLLLLLLCSIRLTSCYYKLGTLQSAASLEKNQTEDPNAEESR